LFQKGFIVPLIHKIILFPFKRPHRMERTTTRRTTSATATFLWRPFSFPTPNIP